MSSSHATSAEAATGDSGYAPPPAEIPQGTANGQAAAAAGSATVTITEEQAQSEEEVLMLHLRPRPSVRWDENVIDNEGLGRKSSKRCCIFHKQRAFGESSSDSSDCESDRSGSSVSSGAGDGEDKKPKAVRKPRRRKIARPKEKKVPDYQRYHA